MIEGTRGAGFLFETVEPIGRRVNRREALDGDIAAQRSIVSAIDLAHPALANKGANLITPEPRADRNVHKRGTEEAAILNEVATGALPNLLSRLVSLGGSRRCKPVK